MSWDYYPPKPSVASMRAKAIEKADALQKKNNDVQPVVIEGSRIVLTFWGKAWCDNLTAYHDFSNRLPRGRSYARNRAIVDLQIVEGEIEARLMGSTLYNVRISIEKLSKKTWIDFKKDTTGQISSAIALLKGELPKDVLSRIVDLKTGLFPTPSEITMSCDCPDGARMCKHIAATMYGVGHRLDSKPEMLFTLRGVDQSELLQQVISTSGKKTTATSSKPQVAQKHLEGIFGVKIDKKLTGFDDLLASAVSKKKAASKKIQKKKNSKKKRAVKKRA